jgi:uncharacterized membrane protein
MKAIHVQERKNQMKTSMTIVIGLALTILAGCQSNGTQGGTVPNGQGFRITVPTFTTTIKQGELQTVTVSVNRDDYFKQDVRVDVKTPAGLTIDPTSVRVTAADKPDVQLRISANKDAAIGEYRVDVKATPETGEPSVGYFNVTVVVP